MYRRVRQTDRQADRPAFCSAETSLRFHGRCRHVFLQNLPLSNFVLQISSSLLLFSFYSFLPRVLLNPYLCTSILPSLILKKNSIFSFYLLSSPFLSFISSFYFPEYDVNRVFRNLLCCSQVARRHIHVHPVEILKSHTGRSASELISSLFIHDTSALQRFVINCLLSFVTACTLNCATGLMVGIDKAILKNLE